MKALNRWVVTASSAPRRKLAFAARLVDPSTSDTAPGCAAGAIPASRLRAGSMGTATSPTNARMPAISRSPTARSALVGIAWDGWQPASRMIDWVRTSRPAAVVTHRGELPPSARPASSATARKAGSTSLRVPPLFARATPPSTASTAQPASSSRGTRRAPIRGGPAGRAPHDQRGLPERVEVADGQRLPAHLLEDVVGVPASAGQPECERADAEDGAFGDRGDAGEPAARAGQQYGGHHDPLGQPGLLGERRGGEQHPGGDSASGPAHPPDGVQAADAEREEERVDPGSVEPRVRDEVGRGEHARGADP